MTMYLALAYFLNGSIITIDNEKERYPMDSVTTIGAIVSTSSMDTALTVLYVLLGILVFGSFALTLALKKKKNQQKIQKIPTWHVLCGHTGSADLHRHVR